MVNAKFTVGFNFCMPSGQTQEWIAVNTSSYITLLTISSTGKYFASTIFLGVISTSTTVVTLHIHRKGQYGYKVPSLLRTVVLDKMARVLCLKKIVEINCSQTHTNQVSNISTYVHKYAL